MDLESIVAQLAEASVEETKDILKDVQKKIENTAREDADRIVIQKETALQEANSKLKDAQTALDDANTQATERLDKLKATLAETEKTAKDKETLAKTLEKDKMNTTIKSQALEKELQSVTAQWNDVIPQISSLSNIAADLPSNIVNSNTYKDTIANLKAVSQKVVQTAQPPKTSPQFFNIPSQHANNIKFKVTQEKFSNNTSWTLWRNSCRETIIANGYSQLQGIAFVKSLLTGEALQMSQHIKPSDYDSLESYLNELSKIFEPPGFQAANLAILRSLTQGNLTVMNYSALLRQAFERAYPSRPLETDEEVIRQFVDGLTDEDMRKQVRRRVEDMNPKTFQAAVDAAIKESGLIIAETPTVYGDDNRKYMTTNTPFWLAEPKPEPEPDRTINQMHNKPFRKRTQPPNGQYRPIRQFGNTHSSVKVAPPPKRNYTNRNYKPYKPFYPRRNERKNMYCSFHKAYTHNTADCRAVNNPKNAENHNRRDQSNVRHSKNAIRSCTFEDPYNDTRNEFATHSCGDRNIETIEFPDQLWNATINSISLTAGTNNMAAAMLDAENLFLEEENELETPVSSPTQDWSNTNDTSQTPEPNADMPTKEASDKTQAQTEQTVESNQQKQENQQDNDFTQAQKAEQTSKRNYLRLKDKIQEVEYRVENLEYSMGTTFYPQPFRPYMRTTSPRPTGLRRPFNIPYNGRGRRQEQWRRDDSQSSRRSDTSPGKDQAKKGKQKQTGESRNSSHTNKEKHHSVKHSEHCPIP